MKCGQEISGGDGAFINAAGIGQLAQSQTHEMYRIASKESVTEEAMMPQICCYRGSVRLCASLWLERFPLPEPRIKVNMFRVSVN